MKKLCSVFFRMVLGIVVMSATANVYAIPILEDDRSAVTYFFGAPLSRNFTYDFVTQKFTATVTGEAVLLTDSAPPYDRVDGVFSLSADIDHLGNLNSGSATWVGGSTGLGIAPGTLLLQADVVAFAHVDQPGEDIPNLESYLPHPTFQFVLQTVVEHAAMGFHEYLDWRVFADAATVPNPFSRDFNTDGFRGEDLLNTNVVAVSEPAVAVLLLTSLLLWRVQAKSRQGKASVV